MLQKPSQPLLSLLVYGAPGYVKALDSSLTPHVVLLSRNTCRTLSRVFIFPDIFSSSKMIIEVMFCFLLLCSYHCVDVESQMGLGLSL